jgi:hypothetical protein
MAKFALGEFVANEKGHTVIVRAVFQTKEGQQQYAVELLGAISFVEETRLTSVARADLAA